jgi:hypothetical protein
MAPPPADLEEWRFEGLAKKTDFLVDHPATSVGSQVYITARYTNARGEPGPAAQPVKTTVAGAIAA